MEEIFEKYKIGDPCYVVLENVRNTSNFVSARGVIKGVSVSKINKDGFSVSIRVLVNDKIYEVTNLNLFSLDEKETIKVCEDLKREGLDISNRQREFIQKTSGVNNV